MTVWSVWLVNKAGGLAYQRTLAEGFHPKLVSNDYLVIASMFQSVHAISSKVSPIAGSGGVETIEWHGSEPYNIHCLQTPTGLKILMTASPNHTGCEILLGRIYELYADYVMKNPFHTPEMPVRCELFDVNLLVALK
jgi:hypothetical protein